MATPSLTETTGLLGALTVGVLVLAEDAHRAGTAVVAVAAALVIAVAADRHRED